MRGVISGLKRSLSGMFFIEGEYGTTYFSHVRNLEDRKQAKKYLYNGNSASFSVVDDGKAHLTAVHVVLDEIDDPLKEEKRERRIEDARRAEEKRRKKEANYVKSLEEKVRYFEKMDLRAKYERYVVQEYKDGVWKDLYISGQPVLFNNAFDAVEYVRKNKGNGTQMRTKKALVFNTRDGLVIKIVKKEK